MKVRYITDTGEKAWIRKIEDYTVCCRDLNADADMNAVDYL
jgi:hypothetical protein